METAVVRAKMHELKTVGIGWALDDFGTGFSSLAMLRTLPVTKLKIDRQFVNDAKADESSRRLLAKIVEISEVMGMVALAEGIEEAQQCEMLSAMGCRHFQGFLFGRPQPAQDLERLAVLQAATERNLATGATAPT
ncbi:EAL domain-containing protein [Xanthomonas sp. LMG 8993]|uniref:EAL domain-containing protein n=1 Tax=Xanthomonas sp. LMG 8993 TaxID=2294032 RepID=UPI0031B6B0E4